MLKDQPGSFNEKNGVSYNKGLAITQTESCHKNCVKHAVEGCANNRMPCAVSVFVSEVHTMN